MSSLCWKRGIETNVEREKVVLKVSQLSCILIRQKMHCIFLRAWRQLCISSLISKEIILHFHNKHGVYHQVLTAWNMGSLPRSSHPGKDWEYRREEVPEEDHPPSKLQPVQF